MTQGGVLLPALDALAAPSPRRQLAALAAHAGAPGSGPAVVEALAAGLEPPRDRYGRPHTCAYHLLLWPDAAQIEVAAPVLLTDEVLVDLLAGPALGAVGRALHAVPALAGLQMVVGTHLAELGGALAPPGASPASWLPAFDRALAREAATRGVRAVFWKDVPADSALCAALAALGYAPFVSLPATRLDLAATPDLDALLLKLGEVASYGDLLRKARSGGYDTPGLRAHLRAREARRGAPDPAAASARAQARHDARAARVLAAHGASGQKIDWIVRERLSDEEQRACHALYLRRLERARFRWEVLAPGFFAALSAQDEARFTLARLDERVVGFSCSVVAGGVWAALRSGAEPALARPLSISPLLVLRDIEAAQEEGCHTILLGPTSYPMKARFAPTFVPTVAMMRLCGPLRPATRAIAALIDRANREAGVGELHRVTLDDIWAPRAAAEGARQPDPLRLR